MLKIYFNYLQLVQPAKTRWGTIFACFETILKSEEIIHRIVHQREFVTAPHNQKETRQAIKNTISSEDFVANLKKAIFILEPINILIKKFQGDNVPISEVYADFVDLPKKFDCEDAGTHLLIGEAKFIKDNIRVIFYIIFTKI